MTNESTTCTNCGSLNPATRVFCATCGTQLQARVAAATPAPVVRPPSSRAFGAASAGSPFANSDIVTEIQQRARQRWLPLLVVLAMTVLDWRLHEDAGVSILLGLLAAAGTLYYPEIKDQIMRSLNLDHQGPRVQTVLMIAPMAVFFLLRGKGEEFEGIGGLTFGDGLIIAAILIAGTLLLQNVMPNIDDSLRGFFEMRDQYLPRPACIVAMVVLSAVLTFGAVHGEIGDIQVLFGQDASKSAFPKLGNMMVIVLLNMALGVAFLRQARR